MFWLIYWSFPSRPTYCSVWVLRDREGFATFFSSPSLFISPKENGDCKCRKVMRKVSRSESADCQWKSNNGTSWPELLTAELEFNWTVPELGFIWTIRELEFNFCAVVVGLSVSLPLRQVFDCKLTTFFVVGAGSQFCLLRTAVGKVLQTPCNECFF
jgi:hypothetical protein